MLRSKNFFRIFALVLLIGAGACFSFSTTETGSKRSDYPVLKPSPFYLISQEYTAEQLLEDSDLVIEATVQEVYPLDTIEHYPEPGSAEALSLQKAGTDHYDIPVQRVKLRVNDLILGEAEEYIIMPIVSVNLDSCPDFEPGDRFVLALREYMYGGFTNTAPVASYFFVSDDNKVYPAGEEQDFLRFSGMNLEQFKLTLENL